MFELRLISAFVTITNGNALQDLSESDTKNYSRTPAPEGVLGLAYLLILIPHRLF
jgi:hypothetical protein